MKVIKGLFWWIVRVFKEDTLSDLAVGVMGGAVAFFMLAHAYSFSLALAAGLGLCALIVIVLRLAVSSPRLTVVLSAIVLVAMTVIGSGLHALK